MYTLHVICVCVFIKAMRPDMKTFCAIFLQTIQNMIKSISTVDLSVCIEQTKKKRNNLERCCFLDNEIFINCILCNFKMCPYKCLNLGKKFYNKLSIFFL